MLSSRRTFFVALLSAFAALAAFGASSASAAPNEVAYSCNELDVCLLDPDNPGAITNLTDNGAVSIDEKPFWSPDGKKLGFLSNFGGQGVKNIFTMEPEASGEGINLATSITHFTSASVIITEAVWSPDGSKIAFSYEPSYSAPFSVMVANADGSSANPVPIAEGLPSNTQPPHPSFSPDGNRIAYGNGEQIYVASANASSAPVALVNGVGHSPSWSPSGTKIAFDRGNGPPITVVIANADSSGTPLLVPDNAQFSTATWSPDGGRLAYLARSTSGSGEGYFRIVNADGSGDHGLPIVQGQGDEGTYPSWSPNGARLVFGGFYFGEPLNEADNTNNLSITNTDGSGSTSTLVTNLKYTPRPAWRPNPVLAPPPVPPVIQPPLAGPTVKPKVVWITKRIPWTPGGPVFVLSVGCGGITCGADAQGKTKYAAPAGLLLAPAPATASAKPKKNPKKPKAVVVGSGKVSVPAGQTRPLMMSLNGKGAALIKRSGHLDVAVTVTITPSGGAKTVESRTIHLFYKPAKKKHKHA